LRFGDLIVLNESPLRVRAITGYDSDSGWITEIVIRFSKGLLRVLESSTLLGVTSSSVTCGSK
jgi:hypothetical protein